MTADDRDLAERQARDAAALAGEVFGTRRPFDYPGPRCTWGDDAWHRAVNRLIRLHRPAYRRLLAEERAKRDV